MDDVDIILSIDHDDVLPGSNNIEIINQWIEDFYAEEHKRLHTYSFLTELIVFGINRETTEEAYIVRPLSTGFKQVTNFWSAVYTGSFRSFPIKEFFAFLRTLNWYDPDGIQIFYSLVGDLTFRIATLSQDDILNDTENQTDECVFCPEPSSKIRSEP